MRLYCAMDGNGSLLGQQKDQLQVFCYNSFGERERAIDNL